MKHYKRLYSSVLALLIVAITMQAPLSVLAKEKDEKENKGKNNSSVSAKSEKKSDDDEDDDDNDERSRLIRNIRFFQDGRAGWITAIRPESNQIDANWRNQIFTLNTSGAELTSGLKKPATLADFWVGQPIHAYITDDNDANPATWTATSVMGLNTKESRAVKAYSLSFPATITSLTPPSISTSTPTSTVTSVTTIEVQLLPNKKGNSKKVTELIGNPGDKVLVDITGKTQLVRRYLGRGVLSEFAVGDKVDVVGKLNDAGHVNAQLIRDASIQRYKVASIKGTVTAVDTTDRKITVKRNDNNQIWTLVLRPTTLIYRGDIFHPIPLSEVKVGDTAHTKGVANRNTKTVDAWRIAIKSPATPPSDTVAPVIGPIATSATSSSVTISWTTNEASDSQVEYGTTTAYGLASTLNTALVTSHSQTLTGLSATTTYHFRVKSKDAAGNLATSTDATFTTAALDITAPVLSAISVSSIATTTAAIIWTTDEMADSQVEYGTTTAYGLASTLNTALVTSHSQTLTGLSATTLYHFRVKSKDGSGNLATSTDATFTTTP